MFRCRFLAELDGRPIPSMLASRHGRLVQRAKASRSQRELQQLADEHHVHELVEALEAAEGERGRDLERSSSSERAPMPRHKTLPRGRFVAARAGMPAAGASAFGPSQTVLDC